MTVITQLNNEDPFVYLRIKLGEQLILIPIHQVDVVLPIAELQQVPVDDNAMEGFLNYHGQSLPVYHLAELINANKPSYDLNTPLLLCTVEAGLVGFLVSDVVDLLSISQQTIQHNHAYQAMPYVQGIVEMETCSAWIVDIEHLFHFHECELKQQKEGYHL